MPLPNESYSMELMKKYQKRVFKKYESRPIEMQLLVSRTFSSSMVVVCLLKDIPFEEITRSVFLYSQDSKFQDIIRQFEAQVELAGANEEKFILALHRFYNDITAKLRSSKSIPQLIEFIGTYMALSVAPETNKYNRRVIDAFSNLLIQALEYIRPDKYDLKKTVIGVSTEGEILVTDALYPFFDYPALVIKKSDYSSHEAMMAEMSRLFKKQGMDVSGIRDLSYYEEVQKIQETTLSAMLPFINEYTSDILPKKVFDGVEEVPLLVKYSLDGPASSVSAMEESLKRRNATLPSNGVHIKFDDSTSAVSELLLKELVRDDTVVMLYRLSTRDGDLTGFYNTRNQFFYSVASNTQVEEVAHAIKLIVLYSYASCVTKAYSSDDYVLKNYGVEVRLETYYSGGKPRNVYSPLETDGGIGVKRRDSADYQPEVAFLNGFIRKLPVGQKASDAAVEAALLMGYELEPDETYVRPFKKTVFVSKKN